MPEGAYHYPFGDDLVGSLASWQPRFLACPYMHACMHACTHTIMCAHMHYVRMSACMHTCRGSHEPGPMSNATCPMSMSYRAQAHIVGPMDPVLCPCPMAIDLCGICAHVHAYIPAHDTCYHYVCTQTLCIHVVGPMNLVLCPPGSCSHSCKRSWSAPGNSCFHS